MRGYRGKVADHVDSEIHGVKIKFGGRGRIKKRLVLLLPYLGGQIGQSLLKTEGDVVNWQEHIQFALNRL